MAMNRTRQTEEVAVHRIKANSDKRNSYQARYDNASEPRNMLVKCPQHFLFVDQEDYEAIDYNNPQAHGGQKYN